MRKGLALSPEGWRLFVQQSVEKNLLLGATPLADKSRIAHMLERVYAAVPEARRAAGKQQAGTMSGGERQMLAVGRALMSEPKLLLLDEPSLGLAPAIIETMYETFLRLHKEGLTVLLAEQSVDLALEVAELRLRAAGRPQRALRRRPRPPRQPRRPAHLPRRGVRRCRAYPLTDGGRGTR